jgi:hypothetical protein
MLADRRRAALDRERAAGAGLTVGHGYSVISRQGAIEKTAGSGLSHAQAMVLAEGLRGRGKIVTIMHVIGEKSYEVDRYPAR